MYLSIGVGVGGHNFIDDSPDKPWSNADPKSQRKFWNAKDTWFKTWTEDSRLQVDYVKIWAL